MIKINFIPDRIGPFRMHQAKKSSMQHGFYYEAQMKLPFADDLRYVRVWLPDTYDFYGNTPCPVMYMSDGQNLVDKYLTAYGDWHLDRVVATLRKEGYPEPILVGIDCPKDPLQRTNELNPPFPVRKKIVKRGGPNAPIGNRFIDYVADVLRPLINEHFHTDTRKEATAIGGSSMGGIMAFYAFMYRPDVFGFSLAFSVPFFFIPTVRGGISSANIVPIPSPMGGSSFTSARRKPKSPSSKTRCGCGKNWRRMVLVSVRWASPTIPGRSITRSGGTVLRSERSGSG